MTLLLTLLAVLSVLFFLQRSSPVRLGGGAQYPYPKEVWSPGQWIASGRSRL